MKNVVSGLAPTMTTRIAARAIALVVALLLAGTLVSAPSATARPTSDANASPVAAADSQRAGREPLAKWKCGAWKGHGGIGWRKCARLYDIKDKIKIDYRERFYNKFKRAGNVRCSHAETTSWTFGASVSGEVEAGVIFSKVKVSATASVSRTASTTKTAEVSFRHPGRSYVHCERGIHGFTFSGLIRTQTCDSRGCVFTNTRSFRGSAPEAGFWQYGPGRGGVEIDV